MAGVFSSNSGFCSYSSENTSPPFSKSLIFKQLEKWPLQKAAKHILAWPRFQTCYQVPFSMTVDVLRNMESSRAFYKNLATCGSVWICPVCASKITERRRVELDTAISAAKVFDLNIFLRTFTVPHTGNDSLSDVLSKFGKAIRLMKKRRPYRAWSLRVGLVGTVRALEVTYGQPNGWHVHTHEILFCRSSSSSVLKDDVLPFWKSACLTVGLNEPNYFGVDVRCGDDVVGNYISKWGISSEATKSMIKKGREGRFSPWDMLREFVLTGDEFFSDLFRDYAQNFKGKRQLVWSDGLRRFLGLSIEKSDEELAAEIEKGSDVLASLSLSDWKNVLRHPYDVRGQLLFVAARGGDVLKDFLEKIKIERGEKLS